MTKIKNGKQNGKKKVLSLISRNNEDGISNQTLLPN